MLEAVRSSLYLGSIRSNTITYEGPVPPQLFKSRLESVLKKNRIAFFGYQSFVHLFSGQVHFNFYNLILSSEIEEGCCFQVYFFFTLTLQAEIGPVIFGQHIMIIDYHCLSLQMIPPSISFFSFATQRNSGVTIDLDAYFCNLGASQVGQPQGYSGLIDYQKQWKKLGYLN